MVYPKNIELPVFFKILNKKYLQGFLDGNLYMNNLKYFVDLERKTGQRGIGDIREGSLCNISKHQLFIQYEGGERKEIEIGPPPGIVYDEEALEHPIFCMVGKIFIQDKISDKEYSCSVSLQRDLLKDFVGGQEDDFCVVMIVNCFEFLERVEKALVKEGCSAKSGFIQYRNISMPNIKDGQWVLDNTFTKDVCFRNQSEYRIEIFKQCKELFVLPIGDIRDLAGVLTVNQIEKGFTVLQRILE